MRKLFFLAIVGAFVFLSSFLFEQAKSAPAVSKEIAPKVTPSFLKQNSKWVDSVFNTLSKEAAYSTAFYGSCLFQ